MTLRLRDTALAWLQAGRPGIVVEVAAARGSAMPMFSTLPEPGVAHVSAEIPRLLHSSEPVPAP